MHYKALNNFEYPESVFVRDRLRNGENLTDAERGTIVQVHIGQVLESPPLDLLNSWVRRGLVEQVE